MIDNFDGREVLEAAKFEEAVKEIKNEFKSPFTDEQEKRIRDIILDVIYEMNNDDFDHEGG